MKKHTVTLLLSLLLLLNACQQPKSAFPYPPAEPPDDKYRTFYQVFVYSFADSDGDGIGDFQGLTEQLDYINDGNPGTTSDLGANGIWLMPVMPSPTYHKYDVLDYYAVDPEYGTLEDFDRFIAAAEERDISVIIDLVMNHTAVDHPWFQTAVAALKAGDETNPYIDYYNFSRSKENESWYAIADGWYYEGKFWSGMPDLNLDSEAVRTEFREIMEYWLIDRNVNGFRLDAVKEFYSGQDSRNIELLKWINDTAKAIRPDAYLVGEAWTGFQGYKQYYQSGIDSFMDFAFADASGLTTVSINTANGRDYAQNMAAAQRAITEILPEAINAPFLSNHDTGRLAGFLASDPGKLRMAAAANLFTSGTSFIYYGEEVGMRGSGRDENKRAPLPWAEDSKYLTDGPAEMEAGGFSYPFGTVADQDSDLNSLLNYYREAIIIRNLYPEIARGRTTVAEGFTEQALAPVLKTWEDETGTERESLVLMNFSQQAKAIDLPSPYRDWEQVATLPDAEGQRAELKDAAVRLPPYGVAVLKP